MKGYLFGPIILRCAEYHIECEFSRTSCLPAGNNSSTGCAALFNAALVYFHFIESFLVNEVLSATAVHEHFGELKPIHNWIKDQGGWCSDYPVFSFVTAINSYSYVVPRVYCCYLTDFGESA